MDGPNSDAGEIYRDFSIRIDDDVAGLTPRTEEAASAFAAARPKPTWRGPKRGIDQAARDYIDDVWKQAGK